MSRSSNFDLHAQITNLIVTAIEQGDRVTTLPWRRTGLPNCLPTNAHSKASYNGINIVALWASAMLRGYSSGEWATLRQWNEKGACVRKGEKASPIVFYKLCGRPHNLYYVALADMWRRLRQLRCGVETRGSYATYSSAGDCSPPTRAEINHALRTLQVSDCHRSLSHRPLCRGS